MIPRGASLSFLSSPPRGAGRQALASDLLRVEQSPSPRLRGTLPLRTLPASPR